MTHRTNLWITARQPVISGGHLPGRPQTSVEFRRCHRMDVENLLRRTCPETRRRTRFSTIHRAYYHYCTVLTTDGRKKHRT